MKLPVFPICIFIMLILTLMSSKSWAAGRVVTINENQKLAIDGKAFFPICLSPGPPLNAKSPDGRDALETLHEAGANMLRLGIFDKTTWNPKTEDLLQKHLDWAQAHGMLGLVNLEKLSLITDPKSDQAAHSKAFIDRFKSHPALAAWKTLDEPQWGKAPIDGIANAYKLIKEWDPNHPCWMNQAPRGTIAEITEYNKYCDITGVDIYPVSEPMGKHSHLPNKNISMIGDYAKWVSESVQGKKPFWMVLQISWSGAVPPKPVVYPTLKQERYMVYQAIINGASGLLFFGGANILEGRDKELGWNWTFWQNVLGPVVKEISSPEMKQVLVAPESSTKLKVTGADNIEHTLREAGGNLYLLAAKREGDTKSVTFKGLPQDVKKVEVLFENRSIETVDKGFTDSFGPNDVHVYRMVK